jgi:uncharacterized membrane protein
MKNGREWSWFTRLAAFGALDSLYLLLFQTGKVKHLVCPIFGDGCEQVASSPVAYPSGIPDAVFGVAGYSTAAVASVALQNTEGRTRKTLAGAVIGGLAAAVGLSAFLTYAQPKRTGAWCFWCLASAVTSVTMAAVATSGTLKVLRD